MTLQSYLLFMSASLVLSLIPGPDMLFLLGRCIAHGKRAGVVAALGINLGCYVHLTAAVTGLSAILATSATAFQAVKWAGAIYLVYIGCRTLFSRRGALDLKNIAVDRSMPVSQSKGLLRKIFWQGFLSDVLNPKVALFYLAFLPQFVTPGSAHPAWELIFLGFSANMLGMAVSLMIVLLSVPLTARLRASAVLTRWLDRTIGIMFVALGINLFIQRR